jgi:hypothetical protein
MKPQVNVQPVYDPDKPTRLITGCLRLAYNKVVDGQMPSAKFKNAKPELTYPAVLLIEPNDPILPLMKRAMKAAAIEFFKGEANIPKKLYSPIRDGAEKAEDYEFYAGHLFITATTRSKPGVVDQRNKPVTDQDEIYSGCWVRVEVNAFGYDYGEPGISFGLNNLQKLGDDTQFGGRRPADQVFTPVVDAANPFKGEEAASSMFD